MLGGPGNDLVLVRTLTSIQTSICCRPVHCRATRLGATGAKNSANSTVAHNTVANSTAANGTLANSTTIANDAATNTIGRLPAVYCFQVSIGQFNFPNRVRWKGAAFLFAQALKIRFVFPCAYDVDLHLFSPF